MRCFSSGETCLSYLFINTYIFLDMNNYIVYLCINFVYLCSLIFCLFRLKIN